MSDPSFIWACTAQSEEDRKLKFINWYLVKVEVLLNIKIWHFVPNFDIWRNFNSVIDRSLKKLKWGCALCTVRGGPSAEGGAGGAGDRPPWQPLQWPRQQEGSRADHRPHQVRHHLHDQRTQATQVHDTALHRDEGMGVWEKLLKG